MTNIYSSLALSYRQWHYRMTPDGWERNGPAVEFSAFQGFNILSLVMLALPYAIPDWLFVGLPFVGGACLFWLATRIYREHPISPSYAKPSDAVPGVREFPLVYAYLLSTLALFVGCVYAVVHSTA